MILEKYKNRYSFNFLAVCGWIVFAWFCIFTCPEIFTTYIMQDTQHAFGVGVSLLRITIFAIICIIPFFVILILEQIFNISIKNEKFLSNKIIAKIQIFGIICLLSPIFFMGLLCLTVIIELILNMSG